MMDKKTAAKLGEKVLENTLKVIMDLPDGDTMVIGTEELTKAQIIQRFNEGGEFAVLIAERLDKTVKEFLFRKKRGKKKRKKNG